MVISPETFTPSVTPQDDEPHEETPPVWPTSEQLASLELQPQPIILRTQHLNAGFGKEQILHDINVEFPQHQITALIGPSGCGKTTLIRCLNRLHETDPKARITGQVLLHGPNGSINIYDQRDPTLVRRQVGMVFQKPNPFPTKSIYENVSIGYEIHRGKEKPAKMDEIVETALQAVGLWDEVKDKLNKSGADLSGGQQQRLCIARAIAIQPQVLLMDEPCSQLDPIATFKIEEVMTTLTQNLSVVLVTHNLHQAGRVSHQTCFISQGQIIECGATQQMFTRPQNSQTEQYLSFHLW